MSDQAPNDQSTAILKELSDIKAALAVNSSETINIKTTITEVKVDIKEIKNDYIVRREFDELIKALTKSYEDKLATVQGQVALMQKIVYSVFTTAGLAVAAAIMKVVLK